MITVRRAIEKDDEAIREMIASITETELPEQDRSYIGPDVREVSKFYAGQGEAFFVAVDGEQVVGTVGVKQEDDRVALMRRIFVRPQYRKQRVGTRLIEKVVSFCSEMGYEEIIFKTTSRMKEAGALCEANHFLRRAAIQLGELELFKFTRALADTAVK